MCKDKRGGSGISDLVGLQYEPLLYDNGVNLVCSMVKLQLNYPCGFSDKMGFPQNILYCILEFTNRIKACIISGKTMKDKS